MSRRKGSKNRQPFYYSFNSLQKKALTLSETLDKFITVAYRNQSFNKLVDFNRLHEVKDQLKELGSDKSKP